MANTKKNNASVWTWAVAPLNNQPTSELPKANVKLMSSASDYSQQLIQNSESRNGLMSQASDYTQSILNKNNNQANTNTNAWLTAKWSTPTSTTKKTTSTNTQTTTPTTETTTTSELDKRKSMLDDMKAKWQITDDQYNSTLQQIQSKFGEGTTTPTPTTETTTPTGNDFEETQAGFFKDAEWNEIKIYGYQALSPDMKKYVDQMSDAEKKKISNMWAQALQNYIKQYVDSQTELEYRQWMFDKAKDLRDIQQQQETIQYWQQLRQAEEQVNNLMQNWEYLWNMWMPWLSKTKLQAISDSIKEANTSLNELTRLQQLSKEASAKQRDVDVAQYEKQISDIVRDLNYKIPQEIQNALNKYTVAELEGNLDTIDWIVAFKKSLLDDLDNNISGMTSASLEQMQYITDTYMNLANQAYEEAKLYKENQNVVNAEMSSVKGYYVDWNGDPILDSSWLPIKIPQSAPMDPVFDKESGRLITFGYDENWNIVANWQQVYQWNQSATQATIVSLLEQWVSVQDILKYVPDADLKTVQELSKVVSTQYRSDWLPITYNGKSYTPTTQDKVNAVLSTLTKGWWGWQCGYFVNNYLQDLWVGRLYSDPITDKTKNINSTEAKVWSVVVMDSPTKPEYGHVWIITAIDPNTGDMTILQSNKNGNEQIYTSKKNINDDWIYGFFDPTKSIEQYNSENKLNVGWTTNEWWYDSNYIADYDTFLKKWINGFTKATQEILANQFGSLNNFAQQANAYKAEIEQQVPESARVLLAAIEEMKKMSRKEYAQAATWLPYTDGYKYRKKFDQFIASASLQNLIDLKSQGATFGALSDNELWFITNSATDIDFKMKYKDFMKNLEQYENTLKNKLNKYKNEGSTLSDADINQVNSMVWGRWVYWSY